MASAAGAARCGSEGLDVCVPEGGRANWDAVYTTLDRLLEGDSDHVSTWIVFSWLVGSSQAG